MARGDLGAPDDVAANLLAQMEVEHVFEHGAHHRAEPARALGQATPDVRLGAPSFERGLGDQRATCRRHLRQRQADDTRDLQDALVRQSRLSQGGHSLRRLQVLVRERLLVRAGVREAEREPVATQQIRVHPGPLGHLRGGVAPPLGLEHALDGKQGQTVLLDRAAKLLERDTVGGQLLEQLPPGLASLPARSLQQALGLEVDRHGQDSSSREPDIPTMDPWRTMGSSFRSSSSPR